MTFYSRVKSNLNETTNKGIEARKDEYRKRAEKALKAAGDPKPEELIGLANRLPADVYEELEKYDRETWCIEMIHSILTYGRGGNSNPEEVVNDHYLEKYVNELGRDKVMELVKQEIEEYKDAEIGYAGEDSEGVTYNYTKFKDEMDESETEKEKASADAARKHLDVISKELEEAVEDVHGIQEWRKLLNSVKLIVEEYLEE